MARQFKLDGLYALVGPKGEFYNRIFLTIEEAKECNKVCYNSLGKVHIAFIND